MDARQRLFSSRAPYDLAGTDALFLSAMRENAQFELTHCPEYAAICRGEGFSPSCLQSIADLRRLPILPTLYLKSHPLSSMPRGRFQITATSSGTGGRATELRFDTGGLWCGIQMVLRLTRFHRLRSPIPAHYLVMGYRPHRGNQMAVAKTAFGMTLFTPALSRAYALQFRDGGYHADLDAVQHTLLRLAQSAFPTRIIGFPAYTWFLMQRLHAAGVRLRLPDGSRVLLGGGWKQFYREQVDKEAFYALMQETLGLPASCCAEFFGAVEHPILYCTCENYHFHLPVYSRVLIRDAKTLEPVPLGTPGLVNLLTPMVRSAPLLSVMTDDLGVLHEPGDCGCSIPTPHLELIGRVGMQGLVTCAAGAQRLLESGRDAR